MRREEPREIRAGDKGADPLEETLLAIWSRVLDTNVGLHDDFFDDLGGSSLDAAELVAEIKYVTGRAMQLSLLIEQNSVAKMAAHLRARPTLEGTLIAIQPAGSLPPLFCVSGKGGSVIIFRELAACLGAEQPFYGISHHGFEPGAFPTTLRQLASCYAEVIREKQPNGPYHIAGYSAGGFVAFEIARLLQQAGEEVAFVGLIDTAAVREGAPAWKKYLRMLRDRPLQNGWRFSSAVGRRLRRLARRVVGIAELPITEIEAMRRLFSTLSREPLGHHTARVTLFRAQDLLGGGRAPPIREGDPVDESGNHRRPRRARFGSFRIRGRSGRSVPARSCQRAPAQRGCWEKAFSEKGEARGLTGSPRPAVRRARRSAATGRAVPRAFRLPRALLRRAPECDRPSARWRSGARSAPPSCLCSTP